MEFPVGDTGPIPDGESIAARNARNPSRPFVSTVLRCIGVLGIIGAFFLSLSVNSGPGFLFIAEAAAIINCFLLFGLAKIIDLLHDIAINTRKSQPQ